MGELVICPFCGVELEFTRTSVYPEGYHVHPGGGECIDRGRIVRAWDLARYKNRVAQDRAVQRALKGVLEDIHEIEDTNPHSNPLRTMIDGPRFGNWLRKRIKSLSVKQVEQPGVEE